MDETKFKKILKLDFVNFLKKFDSLKLDFGDFNSFFEIWILIFFKNFKKFFFKIWIENVHHMEQRPSSSPSKVKIWGDGPIIFSAQAFSNPIPQRFQQSYAPATGLPKDVDACVTRTVMKLLYATRPVISVT